MGRTISAVQLDLFGFAPESGDVSVSNDIPDFYDPSFSSNKVVPVHRWVPWIAGFSRVFVQGVLKRYLTGRGTVLDPFAGVGTTLVEAILAGHDSIGFEINPYAALACRVKTNAHQLDPDILADTLKKFREFHTRASRNDYSPHSKPPSGFKTRMPFYSPKVLRKVLIVCDFIADLRDETLRNLFRIAFASTMVTYSNYSYEPSLGRRSAAGKEDIEDFPVEWVVENKVQEMRQDIIWMVEKLNGERPRVRIFEESFFGCQGKMQPESVDLIVTSPPYLNNYHYNRNTRPHLYWLGFAEKPSDIKPLEEENFGKYWQTVRARNRIDLDFQLDDGEIHECLKLLRTKKPEKGVYGGNGWANYATSYFNDCYRFAESAKYTLRRGGTAIVVIGNSILQGVMIPTDRYFAAIAESVGLKLVDIHVPRASRVGNSIIQSSVRGVKAKKSHKLYEAVVELRKQ